MKKYFITLVTISFLLAIVACGNPDKIKPSSNQFQRLLRLLEKQGGVESYVQPPSHELAMIPQDPKNPLTRIKVALGKLLFFETALNIQPIRPEGMHTTSCATCHDPNFGFQSGQIQAIGEGGIGCGSGRRPHENYAPGEPDEQPIATPTALLGAFKLTTLHNGQLGNTKQNDGTESKWQGPIANNYLGFLGLETQAIAGLEVHRMDLDSNWVKQFGYKEMFDEAFPLFPDSIRYSRITAGLAIAAYERTLLTTQAPFQQSLQLGQNQMTNAQVKGALVFFDPKKGNCAQCHNGPSFSDGNFYALGMDDLPGTPISDPAHLGRGGFTDRGEDYYAFVTPQLYNLKDFGLYGHGRSFKSIREVVEYHLSGEPQKDIDRRQLAEYFITPPQLKDEDLNHLIRFLEEALYDPSLYRYVPDAVRSGFPFPNNDPVSANQAGCI